ncbi:PH domain-containing protein [Nocardioides panacisoli]|uniref:Low molecular weight protein antigen 6 PH domain-containing protein n=1 Tax=Nocardioides panacisoli TaxID=627624 RepID=A0ABP7J071_9ACTN
MPAGSEPAALSPLPRTWRPFGPRLAAVGFGGLLVGAFLALWFTFPPETRAQFSVLQRVTVIFFILVGVALLYALARSRVTATEAAVVVVNGYRKRSFEWAEVVAIRMPPGAPWPTADIADGSTVSLLGIQGSDGVRALTAVAEVRALLDARSGRPGA